MKPKLGRHNEVPESSRERLSIFSACCLLMLLNKDCLLLKIIFWFWYQSTQNLTLIIFQTNIGVIRSRFDPQMTFHISENCLRACRGVSMFFYFKYLAQKNGVFSIYLWLWPPVAPENFFENLPMFKKFLLDLRWSGSKIDGKDGIFVS